MTSLEIQERYVEMGKLSDKTPGIMLNLSVLIKIPPLETYPAPTPKLSTTSGNPLKTEISTWVLQLGLRM